MKIGIVGVGMVGGAVKYGMEKLGHDVAVHDIKMETDISNVLDAQLCFVCVPTPENEDGSCNTEIVEETIRKLWSHNYYGTIAIKSTVSPGTTERLDKIKSTFDIILKPLCFVPEFLRERCAISDFTENHDVCVIGCKEDWQYQLIKKAHGKYPKSFVRMTPTEAELSKYFSNIFNALRVVFANGFYEVCQRMGADYSRIKNAVVQRPTLVDLYLDCNEKFRGFAGVCLPKDTAAFAKLADDLGIDARIFSTIVEDNKLYKSTVPDGMRIR